MLSQLTIRNFAIVDHLQIDWHPGLNVITGETGAGKSILIDAVGALLGDRLGPEIVRSGATRALVEGVFTVASADPPAQLKAVLDEYGLEPEDGALIVSREIAGSGGGRGGARINGRGVPLSEGAIYHDLRSRHSARRRHLVGGETNVCLISAVDGDRDSVGL